jgi:GTPase SAR1 family protein
MNWLAKNSKLIKYSGAALAVLALSVGGAELLFPRDTGNDLLITTSASVIVGAFLLAMAGTESDGHRFGGVAAGLPVLPDGTELAGAVPSGLARWRINYATCRDPHIVRMLKDLRACSEERITSQLAVLMDKGKLTIPWTVVRPAPTAYAGTVNGVEGGGAEAAKNAGGRDDYSMGSLAKLLDHGEGQLFIVGQSDSGKTTMAFSLIAWLLEEEPQFPVPALFALSSWNPHEINLHEWMVQTMRSEFPQVTSGYRNSDLLQGFTSGLILPVLDGFDEIMHVLQDDAAEAISRSAAGLPMVVTSRPLKPGGLRVQSGMLPRGAVIQLGGVDLAETIEYLQYGKDAGNEEIWQGVATAVRGDQGLALANILSSPLMAWLARTVYAPSLTEQRDPSELLDTENFPDEETLEQHLLKELVPSVFRRSRLAAEGDPLKRSRPDEAAHWLGFLASGTRQGGRIAFWELPRLAPMRRLGLIPAVGGGALVGLCAAEAAAVAVSLELSALFGLFFGFGFGRAYSLARASGPRDPGRFGFGGGQEGTDLDLPVHLARLFYGLFLVAASCAVAALSYPLWHNAVSGSGSGAAGFSRTVVASGGSRRRLVDWTLVAVVFVSLVSFIGGGIAAQILQNNKGFDSRMAAQAKTPSAAVHSDRNSGLGMVALAWLCNGLLCAAVLLLSSGRGVVVDIYIGLGTGLCASLSATMLFNGWLPYKIAHIWLASRRKLPWPLAVFLDEAHQNGALYQNGSSYEFRHERLRVSLAAAYRTGTRPVSEAASAVGLG